MVMVIPITVSDPLRAPSVLVAMTNWKVPVPTPEPPITVIQGMLDVTVHAHPAWVFMVKVYVPPIAEGLMFPPVTLYVQVGVGVGVGVDVTAACDTVTV